MHKTVSASIGSSLFVIEESAFATLDTYLKSIRAHFAATSDADEIVSDIEDRIAEEFTAALGAKKKVILPKDVDAVIARMGTVEDFRDFDGVERGTNAAERATPLGKLRLYRDADDQIIGGVCAGIAKYFSIDPLIVRIAFALSLLLGGFGVVLYVVLWILLPEARTTAEKVEMTGGRVTLSAIQSRIDAVVTPEQRKSVLARVIRFPFAIIGAVLRGAGRLLKTLLPIAARLLGVLATIWAAFAMAFVTFVFLALLTNPASPYIGFPLLETIGFGPYVALLLSGYFAAFLPLLFVLLVGASLVMLRNVFTWPATGGIFCAWLLAIVVGGVTIFGAAPKLETAILEFERTVTREYAVGGFDDIRAEGVQRFEVRQGEEFSVVISGSERGVKSLTPISEKGILTVHHKREDDPCMILCFDDRATVIVTMPALGTIEAFDASRVTFGGFSGATLELFAQDVARIDGKISTGTLTTKAEDAARVTLSGTARDVSLAASDVARIDAFNLIAQRVTATASDASRIDVDARESLDATTTDVGQIRQNDDERERE